MPLTATGTADKIRQELFERWIPFIEFEHPDLSPTFAGGILGLVADNNEHIVDFGSGARTYAPAPFEPSLMPSENDRPPIARILIRAMDAGIRAVRLVNAGGTKVQTRMFVALEGDFATVPCPIQRKAAGFTFSISYDAFVIEVPISPEIISDEAQSRYQFTPHNNPALFNVTS